MRPPRGGGSFRGACRRGSRGGGHGGFGGRGGDGSCDEGPPSEVVEISSFVHACKGEAVTKLTQEKIPCFNAPIYLQNKIQIGKVEEIFGPINESFFSIKMMEGMVATSYAPGDKFYIDPAKLLPLARFLPQPKVATDDIAQLGALELEGEGAKPFTRDEVFTINPRTMLQKLTKTKTDLHHLPVRGRLNSYFIKSKRWYAYFAHKGDRSLNRFNLSIMSALIVHIMKRIEDRVDGKLFGLLTIRYFYYLLKNTPKFQSLNITMPKVTGFIDDLCCHFHCNRQSLGVTSSNSDSVYVGHIIVVRRDFDSCEDLEEDGSRLSQPYRINFSNVKSIKIAKVAPKFILIVEKMSIFEELLSYRFHQKFPSVVITGAGEASLDCRAFIKMVSDSLNVPVLMLADNNSFGFEIFKTLKYGSFYMAFMAKNLVVPSIHFIGLLRSDLEEYNISDSDMILASENEISKARKMKSEDWIQYEPAISKDLDFFLEYKKSADIESLSVNNGPGFLVEPYLRRKIEEIVH